MSLYNKIPIFIKEELREYPNKVITKSDIEDIIEALRLIPEDIEDIKESQACIRYYFQIYGNINGLILAYKLKFIPFPYINYY